jgi:hypothetical protein
MTNTLPPVNSFTLKPNHPAIAQQQTAIDLIKDEQRRPKMISTPFKTLGFQPKIAKISKMCAQ